MLVRNQLLKVIAEKWDKLVLEGSGSASQPTGVLNTPAIGAVTFGATPTFAKMISFERALATANAAQGRLAYVTSSAAKCALKSIPKVSSSTFPIYIWETGNFNDGSQDGLVNGYRAVDTNQISNDAVAFGNWEDATLGLWGTGLELITNPFAYDQSAQIRLTLHSWVDVAVGHPASFCWSSDAATQ
jgi:HK97 family phage major capsid protein